MKNFPGEKRWANEGEVVRWHYYRTLILTNGNRSVSARLLGVSVRTFQRKMKAWHHQKLTAGKGNNLELLLKEQEFMLAYVEALEKNLFPQTDNPYGVSDEELAS